MSMDGSHISGDCRLDERVWEGLEYLESVAGPGAVAEMIDHFGQDMPDRIQRMKVLLASGDLTLLARLAHDLKSNSATLGIPLLSGLGKRIEAAAEGRSDEAIAPLIQEVEALLPRVLVLLEDRGSSFTG
jgi:HPt (histidine-containing phosphotransfer) domain-containing protein